MKGRDKVKEIKGTGGERRNRQKEDTERRERRKRERERERDRERERELGFQRFRIRTSEHTEREIGLPPSLSLLLGISVVALAFKESKKGLLFASVSERVHCSRECVGKWRPFKGLESPFSFSVSLFLQPLNPSARRKRFFLPNQHQVGR